MFLTTKENQVIAPEFRELLNPKVINNELQFDIVGTRDTRKLIRATLLVPFRYICHIETDETAGKLPVTGFFIGPRTILTCGHALWDAALDKPIPKDKLTLTPAKNGTAVSSFGSFHPTNCIFSHPGFSNTDHVTNRDYAIMHIADAVGEKTGYFGMPPSKSDPTGSSILKARLPLPAKDLKMNLCGYPMDKGGNLQYLSYNRGFDLQEDRKILAYFNDTKGGHSGSPVWVRRHSSMGGRVIIGIHIGGGPDAKKGGSEYNKAVFITDEVREFIRNNTI
jgi:glutamyl endopeptidase